MSKLPRLLLAGLAAYAVYKYSRMSSDEKKTLVNNLKTKGKKIYDRYVPNGKMAEDLI